MRPAGSQGPRVQGAKVRLGLEVRLEGRFTGPEGGE